VVAAVGGDHSVGDRGRGRGDLGDQVARAGRAAGERQQEEEEETWPGGDVDRRGLEAAAAA
jgi:hypothetical protein